jgi:hypothetical protein
MKQKIISADHLIVVLIFITVVLYYTLFYRKIRDKLINDEKKSKLLKNYPGYTTTSIHFMIIFLISLIIVIVINKFYR